MTPEPKDKLDAMTTRQRRRAPDAVAVVNGPEDDLLDWDAIDWRPVEDDVRRLRQRIFTAIAGRGPQEGSAICRS